MFSDILLDDPFSSLLECFLNHPDPNDIAFPLDYELIQQEQFNDINLQAQRAANPLQFPIHDFGNVQLMCYLSQPNANWRIAIPTPLLANIVRWYHQVLNHIGMTRLQQTIATHFYHPHLRKMVDSVVGNCSICQTYKLAGRGYR